MSAPNPRPSATAAAHIQDLLALHDEAFVASAYMTLLKRPADPIGLASHVALLREGVDKAVLIVELARSKEGLEAAVDLPGLIEFVAALASAQMVGPAGIAGSKPHAGAEARHVADELLANIERADLSPGTAVLAARLGAALRSRQGAA